jgi:hypothetical protein
MNNKVLLLEKKLADSSADSQIDSFIIDAEKNAAQIKPSIGDDLDLSGAPPTSDIDSSVQKTESVKFFGNDYVSSVLRENIDILNEEGEDDKGIKNNLKLKVNVDSPSKPDRKLDKIDVDVFVANMARLMQHTEDLLSIKKVVYNRSLNFLEKNYGLDSKRLAKISFNVNFDVKEEDFEFDNGE